MVQRDPKYDFLKDQSSSPGDSEDNDNEKLTLSKMVSKFLEVKKMGGLSSGTLDQYEQVLGYFMDFIDEDILVKDVTEDMIRKYMQDLLKRNLAITTIGIRYRVLRAFFNWAEEEDITPKAPTDNIEEPKTPKKFPYVLDDDQADQLLEATRERLDHWSGIRNRAIVMVLLDVGLRSRELRSAKLHNLNLDEYELKVHGKSNKDRKVYFGEDTNEWLSHWLDVRGDIEPEITSNTIFIDLNGNRIKQDNLQTIITRLQKRAGLEDAKVSPHVLRHTAATLAVKNGLDVYSLQEMMGHSQLETSMRYVHMTGRRLKEATRNSSPIDSLENDNN